MDEDNEDTPQKQQREEIGLTEDEHMKQTGQRRKRKPVRVLCYLGISTHVIHTG